MFKSRCLILTDPITIDDILNLSPLEVEVLETSLTSMLTSLLDGTQTLGTEVEDEFPRTHTDVYQTLCKARNGELATNCLTK